MIQHRERSRAAAAALSRIVKGDDDSFGATRRRESPPRKGAGGSGYAQYVIARAAVTPGAIAPAIRAAVRGLDPQLPPAKIETLDETFAGQIATPRFYMMLLNACAALGLTLAAIGVYGVIAFGVARRMREFGIRLALGAEPRDIVRLVLAAGMRWIAAGAVVGLAGSMAAMRLLSSLLFEVKPRDPLTFLITGALLAGVALLACWLAARRATGVDPSAALRCE